MKIKQFIEKLKTGLFSDAEPDKQSTPPTSTPAASAVEIETPSTEVKTYHATGMGHRMADLLSLSFENDDFLKSKKALVEDGLIGEKIWERDFYARKVELVPEPDNPYDPKAIKVVADGVHIAYIKKGSCAHLQKVIREGRIEAIRYEIGGGKYKYIAEDWDEDGLKEIYTLEKGSAPYFVWLYVTEKI